MRKSKFRQLENRFFVLQKAEESVDIQNYDEYCKTLSEYTNLLNEWGKTYLYFVEIYKKLTHFHE